eukprot:CAMPEP_0180040210 /NCGR_PEP_ID=MMETSP0984-20121128/33320_1 /TAXON_ID=483367 /ORGANISM="non described non described, Strain CCMP 2436" /LENGTH=150 /DNA_ID=CAMNT_0021967399 /DNA_START=415 /DNA_END=864 /DNA_ORIENTATION=-
MLRKLAPVGECALHPRHGERIDLPRGARNLRELALDRRVAPGISDDQHAPTIGDDLLDRERGSPQRRVGLLGVQHEDTVPQGDRVVDRARVLPPLPREGVAAQSRPDVPAVAGELLREVAQEVDVARRQPCVLRPGAARDAQRAQHVSSP